MRASGPRLQKDLMTTHKPLTLNLIKMLFKKKKSSTAAML